MSTSDRTHDPLGIGPRLHDLDTLLRENAQLREVLAAIYEATADLLDHVTGMTEGEPTPIFEAAERALSEAGVCLGRTGRDG